MTLPLVLVHGYSSSGDAFVPLLKQLGLDPQEVRQVHVGNYRSLTNDVTLKDIGRGFERALAIRAGLEADEPFDAIVHSTGMLVVRTWLTGDPSRRRRLKHLIGVAPATWGSPLAHKGRSWLGAIFKGNKTLGPDFLAAGDQILDGLELGSAFTTELAELDLFGGQEFYGRDNQTPYVFIFVGNSGYHGLSSLVNEKGADGTVRWAGVSLNSRKIIIDLTPFPTNAEQAKVPPSRYSIGPWLSVSEIPVVMIDGVNHGTILSASPEPLIRLIKQALDVKNGEDLDRWNAAAKVVGDAAAKNVGRWQQFIMHAIDSRGDPIDDFNAKLCTRDAQGQFNEVTSFELDVHSYKRDTSYRCFHVDISDFLDKPPANLWLQLIASSSSPYVSYQGELKSAVEDPALQVTTDGTTSTYLDLSALIKGVSANGENVSLFYPFTTTVIELRLHREPQPLDTTVDNLVYRFGSPFT